MRKERSTYFIHLNEADEWVEELEEIYKGPLNLTPSEIVKALIDERRSAFRRPGLLGAFVIIKHEKRLFIICDSVGPGAYSVLRDFTEGGFERIKGGKWYEFDGDGTRIAYMTKEGYIYFKRKY